MSDPDAVVRACPGVRVVVRAGFVDELELAPGTDVAQVRRLINDALLECYEREREASAALDAALERAKQLPSPTLLGQATLPEPPAWVEHVTRLAERSLDSRDD